MSERRRNALLVVLLVAFAALAVAINALLGEDAGEPPPPIGGVVEQGQVEHAASDPGTTDVSRPGPERGRAVRDGARESASPREAAPPERRIEQRDREVLAGAGPVARRFLRAFARYEVGDVGAKTRAGLRATTTAAFFSELVSQPPRIPEGVEPVGAHPGAGFDVVPITADASGRRLLEVELVTSLVRAGERTPIDVRLRRGEGYWRVAGLTR